MKCPCQDMKYWTDDAIFEVDCPECNSTVEFYKDDTSRKCPRCEHRFVNPKLDFGCASYCQFAEQCLGTLPENFLGSREDLLKDKVAVLLKRHLKTDFKRIREATELAQIGETICKQEGGNLVVVLCASYLCRVEDETKSQILKDAGANESLEEIIFQTIHPEAISPNSPVEAQIFADALIFSQHKARLKQQSNTDTKRISLNESDLFTEFAKKLLKELDT